MPVMPGFELEQAFSLTKVSHCIALLTQSNNDANKRPKRGLSLLRVCLGAAGNRVVCYVLCAASGGLNEALVCVSVTQLIPLHY